MQRTFHVPVRRHNDMPSIQSLVFSKLECDARGYVSGKISHDFFDWLVFSRNRPAVKWRKWVYQLIRWIKYLWRWCPHCWSMNKRKMDRGVDAEYKFICFSNYSTLKTKEKRFSVLFLLSSFIRESTTSWRTACAATTTRARYGQNNNVIKRN